jgi:hypothetical protein
MAEVVREEARRRDYCCAQLNGIQRDCGISLKIIE